MSNATNHGHDKWQQSVNSDLDELKEDAKDLRKELGIVQEWRISHMSVCHPKILGRLALIFGVVVGLATAFGYFMGNLYPWLGK